MDEPHRWAELHTHNIPSLVHGIYAYFGPNLQRFVESKTRTYNGWVGAGRRTAGRRGGAEQDGTPKGLLAQETTVPVAP